MKKIFVSIFALSCLGVSQQALAQSASLCMNSCTTSISVNSGHSSTTCRDDMGGCECTNAGQQCQGVVATSYSCSSLGKSSVGTTATGLNCCAGFCNRSPEKMEADTEIQRAVSEDDSLQNVFDGTRTTVFFAYIDSVLRSPNAGRTLIKDAKLDACIGFTNLNSLISNYPSDPYGGWSACTGSGYCGSTNNAYCTANSNQVCLDRCNCKYQSALVGLGYADPGCSNL